MVPGSFGSIPFSVVVVFVVSLWKVDCCPFVSVVVVVVVVVDPWMSLLCHLLLSTLWFVRLFLLVVAWIPPLLQEDAARMCLLYPKK